jgi:cytochrome P450
MSALENGTAEDVALELFNKPEGRRAPYPRYHRLRELEPVHYNGELGMWFLTRYEDCAAMLRDPRFGKNYPAQMESKFGGDWREHPSLARGEHMMLNLEGAEHSRLRRLVVKNFNRRNIDGLRDVITRFVNEALDPLAEAGSGDLLSTLAFPMPVRVIGELLGVPKEDRAQFRGLVLDLTAIFEMQVSDEQLVAADAAQVAIDEYFIGLIEEKRRRPDDKLLSTLVHLEVDGDRLSPDELSTMALLVFAAGFETTSNLIGNSVWGLLQHPDQLKLLRERPDLDETLADELLRYDGTAQMVVRHTHDAVELGDVTIPAGQTVFAMIGSANHDPAEFSEPDHIDVSRGRFRPMSFGGGAHFCLGASLAKAEIEISVRALLDRFDSIELAGAARRFRDRLTLRGLESLEVEVRPAAGSSSRPARSLPVTERPPAGAGVEVAGAEAPVGHVRPASGSEADRLWRNALREKVESEAAGERGVLTGSELAGTIVLLARAELFRSCSSDQIAELAATAYPITFEAGDRICSEGGESLECYVIGEGEAEVTIRGEHIRSVSENDVVGERGLLEDNVRSATVTALSHVDTYAISRQRLLDLLARDPEVEQAMRRYMRERYED